MRVLLMGLALVTLAGCSMGRVAHYSPYDLNYDGTLDAFCPGTDYDTSEYHVYSWRSKASTQCNEQVFGDRAG